MQTKQEKMKQEARQWAMTLTQEDIDGKALREFQAWRALDPNHEIAFQEADRTWRGIGQLTHLRGYAALPDAPLSWVDRFKTWWENGQSQWALGTGFAAMAFVAYLAFPVMFSGYTGYRTGIGEIATITLDDGTQVTLGGKTKIKVKYTEDSRQVKLLRGDALFQVARNEKLPFVVQTGDVETRVLGTMFSVERNPSQLSVGVIEGKVRVGLPGDDPDKRAELLTLGQTIVASYEGELSEVAEVDPSTIGTWVNGQIRYENTTLEDIIADANRYYDKEIKIADIETAKLRVSISFNTDNIPLLVENLALILNLQVKQNLFGTMVLQKYE